MVIGMMFAALVMMQGALLLGALLRMAAQGISEEEAIRRVGSDPLGLGLAQLIAFGLVILVGVRVAHGPSAGLRESLRIRPISPAVVVLALIAGLALQFPLVELTRTIGDLVPAIALDEDERAQLTELTRMDSPLRAIAVPIAIVLIAPLSEELLFRGLFLPATRARLGTIGALLFSSVLFGALHLQPAAAIVAAIAGLVLGAIAIRTRSVLAAIALHAGVNAAPLLLPASIVPVRGFNVAESEHLPLPVLLATSLLAAVALALAYRVSDDAPGSSGDPPA